MRQPRPTLAEDPNVTIPSAVRANAKKADDLHAQAYTPPAPDAELPAPTPEPPAPDAEPPAPTPEPPPTPAPAAQSPEPTPPPAADANDQSWEHKAKTWEGRYKAHKERSDIQIADLSERVAALTTLVNSLQARAPEPAPTPPAPAKRNVTDEQKALFGDDMLAVMSAAAKDTLSPELEALKATLNGINQKLEGTAQVTHQQARDAMYNVLDQRVPGWEQINHSKEFHDWLALPDAYSGVIRNELLKKAHELNQTPQVLAFFRGFLAEQATVTPAPTPQLVPDPAADPAPGPKVKLEDLAAPGRAKSAPAAPAAEKPIIPRDQIAAFYTAKANGFYRGKEAEADAIEKMIFSAQQDGRIR